jgi:hypothetical protein
MSVGLTEPRNASVDPGPIDNGDLEDDDPLCISKRNVRFIFRLAGVLASAVRQCGLNSCVVWPGA